MSDALRQVVERGRGVLVVGTGATMSATGGAVTASWIGLIKHGAEYVEMHTNGASSWKARIDLSIDELIEKPDGPELLQLASQVASKIRSVGDQAFSNWIEEAVGSLEISDESWPRAIVNVGLPIFTTNYDHILEKVSKKAPIDWQAPREFQEALNSADYIGHLHGHFKNPSGIVLSEADYAVQQMSEGMQAVEKAVSATSSLIYIGCGGTLEDPNFSSLLKWHKRTFPISGVQHFRLCTEQELPQLKIEHADSNIVPVSYGTAYTDLPEFLNDLIDDTRVERRPDGMIRDVTTEAREFIVDQLRQETIIGGRHANLDHAELSDITIPPVILPVPHEEYIRSNQENARSLKRIDPIEELQDDGVMVLVAEEASGLSTALRWLAIEASSTRSQIPVALDFRSFPNGHNPLDKVQRRESKNRSLIADLRDDLPPMILSIDNFHGRGRPAERTAAEISRRNELTIIGCKSLDESDATATLAAAGVKFRVRYLGKLGSREVQAIVEIASGGRADALTGLVTNVLRTEHLPRTPFTVALLVEVMLQGETIVANVSPTAILDQYVQHLLGRDDATQDSRTGLSAADRESIMTDLAQEFIRLDAGSIKHSECIVRLENFFDRYAWDESPISVLSDLGKRRVLSIDGNTVRFTQSSFLHLFAAKAAARDSDTRGSLIKRPLYYSTVLRAYAALSRNDRDMLAALSKLIDDTPTPSRSSYEVLEQIEAHESLAERLTELSEIPSPQLDEEEFAQANSFDSSLDSDIVPFPVTDDADLTIMSRFMQSVSLVSVVLRDSEEVEDLELKRDVLRRVLSCWGHLGDLLVEDEHFQSLAQKIRDQLSDAIGDEHREEAMAFLDSFVDLMPQLVTWGGIGASLASKKLNLIARQLSNEVLVREDARTAVPLALLLESSKGDGWESELHSLVMPFSNTAIVSGMVLGVVLLDYRKASPGSHSERKLRDVAADIYMARLKFKNLSQRGAVRSAFIDGIQKEKLAEQRASGAILELDGDQD